MHSINCLSDHGRQAAVENRWSTNCQQTVFPIFLHFPHLDGNLRCAVLRYWNSSEQQKCLSAFKHSHIHSHIHTYTHLQTHTHTHSCTHGICSCCLGQLCELHCSCRKCSILFSAYRQTTFSPVSLPNIPHSPPPVKSHWKMFSFKLCVIHMDKLSANQTEKRNKIAVLFLSFCFVLFCLYFAHQFLNTFIDTHTHTYVGVRACKWE